MSKLLIEEYPLMVLPKLAVKIGLNPAIVLQQIHYWIDGYEKKHDDYHYHDGQWWVFNTLDEWQENFPFWSTKTVQRALNILRDKNLVKTANFNKKRYDRTLWYTIDYEQVELLSISNRTKCPYGDSQDDQIEQDNLTTPIPETTTETTTERIGVLANAESTDSTLDDRGVFVYSFVDNELTEFDCICGQTLDARHLPKTKLKCPYCKVPIEIRDSHDKTIHKPLLATAHRRILGDIIPNCPEKLSGIMYYASQKTKIDILLKSNRDMLLESLNWAIGKFVSGNMPENKVVESALTWAGRRNEVAQKSEPKKKPISPVISYLMKEHDISEEKAKEIISKNAQPIEPVMPDWLQ